jgi:hypothetical protein
MDWLDLLQWPAMAVTVTATGLVGAQSPALRAWGFWLFLASNALWVAWGWYAAAWALVALQVILAGMNVRGAKKNDEAEEDEEAAGAG